MWHQPKAVLAVAFACVIAFMGIGLVDPILVPIAHSLGASPSQTSLLFTSYMAVMGVAMLITGWVSSRFGIKNTLLLGLLIIIVSAGLAGAQDSIAGVVGWRAVWGLGNALFIATALTAIVNSAKGSVKDAIIFYETALGLGIAVGPLIGGALGAITWRAPFFGVSVLMLLALLVTMFLLPKTKPVEHTSSMADPFKALGHPGLLLMGIVALLYNFGFFTLLAYAPFPLDLSAHMIGLIFFGWGLLLAIGAVVVAPRLQGAFGTINTLLAMLFSFAIILAVMAVYTDSKVILSVCIVISGFALGITNTLVTETVMSAAPVPRGVASAAYSFVRFSGAAVAPWLAGYLGETITPHVPFWVGAGSVLLGVVLLAKKRELLAHIDRNIEHPQEELRSESPENLSEASAAQVRQPAG
jgi:predicted MFS family arabinose efflux permease